MSPSESWRKRASEIDDARTAIPNRTDWRNRLLTTLRPLWESDHCSQSVQGWLRLSRNGNRSTITWSQNADGHARHPSLQLFGLEHLEDGALLSVVVNVDEQAALLDYTVQIQGRCRGSRASWYARIDLDPDQRGGGPCSHPLLHCHVGADPEANEPPISRSPLPWLEPDEALEWLLATVHPALEPSSYAER